MALYATEEALEMILAEDFNSGDETDIEEDPSFPLPRLSDQESDSSSESDDDLPLPPPRRSDELNSDGANPSDPESQPFRSRSSSPPRRGLTRGRGRGKGRGRRRGRGRGRGGGSRSRSRSGVDSGKIDSHTTGNYHKVCM